MEILEAHESKGKLIAPYSLASKLSKTAEMPRVVVDIPRLHLHDRPSLLCLHPSVAWEIAAVQVHETIVEHSRGDHSGTGTCMPCDISPAAPQRLHKSATSMTRSLGNGF